MSWAEVAKHLSSIMSKTTNDVAWTSDLIGAMASSALIIRENVKSAIDRCEPMSPQHAELRTVLMALDRVESRITAVVLPLDRIRLERDADIETAHDIAWTMAEREQHSIADPAVRKQVLALTEGKCAYCDAVLVEVGGDGNQFCIEHVVPASMGGPNHLTNYVPSCRTCNTSKGDRHVLLLIRKQLTRRMTGDRE